MEPKVIHYLIHEKHCSDAQIESALRKITKYDDIYQEFLAWLEQRNYQTPTQVTVEGYSAQDIYDKANFLDGIGVYNLLVDLRDEPERVKQYIAEGFPRR